MKNFKKEEILQLVPNKDLEGLASREECRLLSLLIKEKELMAQAIESGINYEYFQSEDYRQMFSFAAEHFHRSDGALLSKAAMDNLLSGRYDAGEIGRYQMVYNKIFAEFGVESGDFDFLKDAIESRYIQRKAWNFTQEFSKELLNATRNQKEIVQKYQNLFDEISIGDSNASFNKVQSMGSMMGDLMKDIENRRDHPEQYHGIKTGLKCLDDDYNGFVRQRYMVITATEGGGKSTFMLNLARNFALMGNCVVYVTIESNNEDIGRRVLTMHSQVDYNRIMRGGSDPEFGLSPYIMNDLKTGGESFVRQAGENLHFVQVLEGTHRETICRLIQRVMAYKKVDVVFIDYLQVVGKEVDYGPRVDQIIADISAKFRAWGRKNDVLLVTAQQIKGDKGKKLQEKMEDDGDDMMIVKADTSSSKEIAGSADYMFGVWIPRTKDRMIVWSTKTRAGKDTQKYVFDYDPNTGRISEESALGAVVKDNALGGRLSQIQKENVKMSLENNNVFDKILKNTSERELAEGNDDEEDDFGSFDDFGGFDVSSGEMF